MSKGKLYLIPSPLSESPVTDVLPARIMEVIAATDCYVVEELRTARRFLSMAGRRGQIDTLQMHELNEHTSPEEVEKLASLFDNDRNVGLISEAGLPAVADPGAALVALCHRKGIRVVPLVGPSSLMLALMASGLNGQSFCFRGYLPAKTPERRARLAELEKTSARLQQSQIFIETPYRNDAMLQDILACCHGDTRLCIAVNITASDEDVRTLTVAQWKKENITIGKRPCVFILYA